MEKKTIVVTGFGPFSSSYINHVVNSSWEGVKILPTLMNKNKFNTDVVVKEVAVAYDEVNNVVPYLWNKYNPILMVHVGVSHAAKCLTLESCANRSGYVKKDVCDSILPGGINASGSEEHIGTMFDTSQIVEQAKKLFVDLETSTDVGRYLCEYIYYTSLNINRYRTIFIHVPMLSEEYTAERIAHEIKVVIGLLLQNLPDCSI